MLYGVLLYSRTAEAIRFGSSSPYSNPSLRITQIAHDLGERGNSQAVKVFIEELVHERENGDEERDRYGDGRLFPAADRAVEQIDFETIISTLEYDDTEEVRQAKIKRLGKIGNRRAVNVLIKALNGFGTYAPMEAATALGELGDPQAVEPLIDALEIPEYPRTSWKWVAAATALAKIGDPRAVNALISLLSVNFEILWAQFCS